MAGAATTRREFVKAGGAALAATAVSWNARSYAAIVGANDRVRVGVVGCGDRMKGALIPAFLQHAKDLNFEFVAVSDIWNRRREEGAAYIQKLSGSSVDPVRNNDELYARKDVDAVLIATADFQHALHGVEAVEAGRDAYVEKPTAHTMDDARKFLAAVRKTRRILQGHIHVDRRRWSSCSARLSLSNRDPATADESWRACASVGNVASAS